MTITACETGSADKRASLDGELAMHFFLRVLRAHNKRGDGDSGHVGDWNPSARREGREHTRSSAPSSRGQRHPVKGRRISRHRIRLVQTGGRVPVLSCQYRSLKGVGLAGAGASDPACTLLEAGCETLDYRGRTGVAFRSSIQSSGKRGACGGSQTAGGWQVQRSRHTPSRRGALPPPMAATGEASSASTEARWPIGSSSAISKG